MLDALKFVPTREECKCGRAAALLFIGPVDCPDMGLMCASCMIEVLDKYLPELSTCTPQYAFIAGLKHFLETVVPPLFRA